MENLINDDLDPSSSGNESDNGFDNESGCILVKIQHTLLNP